MAGALHSHGRNIRTKHIPHPSILLVSPTAVVDEAEADHRRLTDDVFTISDALAAQCDTVPEQIHDVYNDPFTLLWAAILATTTFDVSRTEGMREGVREHKRENTPHPSPSFVASVSPGLT